MRLAARTYIQGNTAPLSDEQIRSVAPSIFATDKHESRSERYTYIPTSEVLAGLRKEGFFPFYAAQGRSRIPGKSDFTKHLIRLRNHNNAVVGESVNEIILLNSHDGTSAWRMMSGIFRFVCTNGMVSGDTTHDIKIRHSGQVIDNVIEGAFRVVDDFARVNEERERLQALSLSVPEQQAFSRAALELRYGNDDVEDVDVKETPTGPLIEAERLNIARRFDDRGNDGWRTFNRVQENIIKGGVQGVSASGRRMTTRPVNSVSENVRLNRALWTLAQELERIKNG